LRRALLPNNGPSSKQYHATRHKQTINIMSKIQHGYPRGGRTGKSNTEQTNKQTNNKQLNQ